MRSYKRYTRRKRLLKQIAVVALVFILGFVLLRAVSYMAIQGEIPMINSFNLFRREIFCSRDRKNGILFTAPDLCCKDIAICSSGSGYDYSFFQYFSLYTTDFGIPDHHRFSSAA